MTYPPGGPGYPQAPQSQFSAPTQQFERVPEPAPSAGPSVPSSSAPSAAPAEPEASKLPVYLSAAVAVLGFAIYLTSFGPVFGEFGGSAFELIIAPVVAGLLAGIGLLPKQTDRSAIAAVFAVLGFLLLILVVVAGAPIDWAFYPFIVFSVLQSIAAVAVVLLDAGVITAPAPRPKYEQHPGYGGYGAPGGYYGQPPMSGPQQPGYPPQQYGGYQGPPNTGGFPALGRPAGPPPGGHFGGPPAGGPQAQTTAWPTSGLPAGPSATTQVAHQNGPPTPPTGFPAFGQPQAQQEAAAEPAEPSPPADAGENPDAQATQVVAPQQSAPPPS